MTDPQNPASSGDQPANQPPAYQPPAAPRYGENAPGYEAPQPSAPAYQAPAYAAPAYNPGGYDGAPQGPVPGRTLGIVALIVAFFASLIGLILGIVALVQSRKAGAKNGFAVAAIIVGSVFLVLSIIAAIVFFSIFASMGNDVYQACVVNGAEYVTVWGQQVPCSEMTQ